MKSYFVVALALSGLLVASPTFADEASSTTARSSQIVATALTEDGVQGGDKYTGGTGRPWCSEFVSYTYRQAGLLDTTLKSTQEWRDWISQHGTWHAKGDGLPQPGDWMSFRNGAHSGLVTAVGYWNGYLFVWTVEGNHKGNDRVQRFVYWIGDGEIDGWGHVSS